MKANASKMKQAFSMMGALVTAFLLAMTLSGCDQEPSSHADEPEGFDQSSLDQISDQPVDDAVIAAEEEEERAQREKAAKQAEESEKAERLATDPAARGEELANQLNALVDEHGQGRLTEEAGIHKLQGVVYADLLDFTGDEKVDLLVCYGGYETSEDGKMPSYTVEIWDVPDYAPRRLIQAEPLTTTTGVYLVLAGDQGVPGLVTGQSGSDGSLLLVSAREGQIGAESLNGSNAAIKELKNQAIATLASTADLSEAPLDSVQLILATLYSGDLPDGEPYAFSPETTDSEQDQAA